MHLSRCWSCSCNKPQRSKRPARVARAASPWAPACLPPSQLPPSPSSRPAPAMTPCCPVTSSACQTSGSSCRLWWPTMRPHPLLPLLLHLRLGALCPPRPCRASPSRRPTSRQSAVSVGGLYAFVGPCTIWRVPNGLYRMASGRHATVLPRYATCTHVLQVHRHRMLAYHVCFQKRKLQQIGSSCCCTACCTADSRFTCGGCFCELLKSTLDGVITTYKNVSGQALLAAHTLLLLWFICMPALLVAHWVIYQISYMCTGSASLKWGFHMPVLRQSRQCFDKHPRISRLYLSTYTCRTRPSWLPCSRQQL